MHTEAKLVGKVRSEIGSIKTRKLRREGRVPANLYGHKETPVPLHFSSRELAPIVRSGVKIVDLEIDGNLSKALLKEVQWDFLGESIQHLDLLRVDPNEQIVAEVSWEVRGTAPGTLGGGILDYHLRHLKIRCPAIQVPDHILLKIGHLNLHDSIHVRDLELPPNVTPLDHPDALIVQVIPVQQQAVDVDTLGGPAQPELIRKPEKTDEAETKK